MAKARGGVHAILGPDSFLAEEALEPLLEEALGKNREGALQVLHGDETSWGRLVETARTGSLFVSRRAIVVRGADGLKGDAIAERDPAAALAFIEELLENGEEGPLILGTLHRSLRQMRALLAMRAK